MVEYTPPAKKFKPKIYYSKRFCLTCKKVTHFKKKKNESHSYCQKCKGFLARRAREGDPK